jgi:hypothetical protein
MMLHVRLGSRNRDRQHVAVGGPELDHVRAVVLRARRSLMRFLLVIAAPAYLLIEDALAMRLERSKA